LISIKVLQKFCTTSRNQRGTKEEPKRNQRGTKEEPKRNQKATKEEPKRNQRENQNSPPLPILSNSLFIKIDLCGIEFAMMIACPYGFGDIVAWGLKAVSTGLFSGSIKT
jgi:hypothetical protein